MQVDMLLPDTSTPEQFEAGLNAVLKDVAPAEIKPPTILARLTRVRIVLKKFRAKGYSAQQIATALRQPPFGLQVSASLVRKAISGRPKKPVQYRAIFPVPAPAAAVMPPQPAPKPSLPVRKPSLPLSQPANTGAPR